MTLILQCLWRERVEGGREEREGEEEKEAHVKVYMYMKLSMQLEKNYNPRVAVLRVI